MALFMGDTASDDPEQPTYPLAAVAGYIAGYVTYPMLLERYGTGRHVLSITPNVDNHAECLDVETGDASAPEAGPWVRQMLNAGIKRPCVYAQLSRMSNVRESLDAAGLSRDSYRLWVALWDGEHDVPYGYDAKQFYGTMDPTGWDFSVISDDFFADVPAPHPPKPQPVKKSMHYDRYPRSWQKALRRYDALRELEHTGHLSKLKVPYLRARRVQCRMFAKSIAKNAIKRYPLKDGRPSWRVEHRGWMYQQLALRSQGRRVVPS